LPGFDEVGEDGALGDHGEVSGRDFVGTDSGERVVIYDVFSSIIAGIAISDDDVEQWPGSFDSQLGALEPKLERRRHSIGDDDLLPIKRELMLRASPDKERHERQQLLTTTVLLTTALGSRGCVGEFASALVEDFGFVGSQFQTRRGR
jgi:hypothetical protein